MAEEKLHTPVVAWATFVNLLDRMATNGVPSRVDKTFLSGMSGATQGQLRASLRAFNLVDDEFRSTPELAQLVDPALRRSALIDLLSKTCQS